LFEYERSDHCSALAGHVIGSIGDAFVIAKWREADGPAGAPRLIAPRHLRHSDDEAGYVLEGVLRVQVGKDEIKAGTGSSVFVPRGTPHTYWNAGPGRVRYLLNQAIDIRGHPQKIHGMAECSPAALRAVFTEVMTPNFSTSRSVSSVVACACGV
jgi:mannose-6-phosphate isomerase-like protein (cupin superfamily)